MLKGYSINSYGNNFCRLCRSPFCHYENQGKVVDHPDRGKEKDHANHMAPLGQSHVKKALKYVSPIYLCRFVSSVETPCRPAKSMMVIYGIKRHIFATTTAPIAASGSANQATFSSMNPMLSRP